MFDPLGLVRENSLALRLHMEGCSCTCRCTGHLFASTPAGAMVTRYLLEEEETQEELMLEVVRDARNDFHIHAYRLIEMRDFSIDLLAILGTESIGFLPQGHTPLGDTLYSRIMSEDERLETCKYICDPAELEEDPYTLGYTRDGYGNWYMMLERSAGRLRHFGPEERRRGWEYENGEGERLLIELDCGGAGEERPGAFSIYLGRALRREQIGVISQRSHIATLTRKERSQPRRERVH